MPALQSVSCLDLEAAIAEHEGQGYRLDAIFPADSPREAILSKSGGELRLVCSKSPATPVSAEWVVGRAGMEYRDLIPDRMGGKVIASHIRLTAGGDVPDYVHYHEIDFQMIYCVRGRIKVVYEDQGQPFWLEAGDCVLQPPKIRHRVLYAEAGSEVVEVTSPAEHETRVEHEMELPNGTIGRERIFDRQTFLHSRAAEADWRQISDDVFVRETGISKACGGVVSARIFKDTANTLDVLQSRRDRECGFSFPLGSGETLVVDFELR